MNVHDSVKEYYGKTLQHQDDLATNACCVGKKDISKEVREALKNVPTEVAERYYGCGIVAPEYLSNCTVLDLGCGSGNDCYVLSQMVGSEGLITGIDMTDEQLAIARKHVSTFLEKYPLAGKLEFINGKIEDLASAGLKKESYDAAISNCVVNLSPRKDLVLKSVFDVLKFGGEFYFSDVYSDRDIPAQLKEDKVLWGECLSGALTITELKRLAKEAGFTMPRLVTFSEITVSDEKRSHLRDMLKDIKFVSATYRLYKVKNEYAASSAMVTYHGDIPLKFDCGLRFEKSQSTHVPATVVNIIRESRFNSYFTIEPTQGDAGNEICDKMGDEDPFLAYSAKKGTCCKKQEKCCQ